MPGGIPQVGKGQSQGREPAEASQPTAIPCGPASDSETLATTSRSWLTPKPPPLLESAQGPKEKAMLQQMGYLGLGRQEAPNISWLCRPLATLLLPQKGQPATPPTPFYHFLLHFRHEELKPEKATSRQGK